ncbi:hypothetical protein KBD45_08105 [Candidatus Dojkabacteria bacterium]|nr:hypothetical protein [Candidatus Dojkabacteria bacterium]
MKIVEWVLIVITSLYIFFVYLLSPITTSYDSRWSIHLGLSIIREHNIDLDEFKSIIGNDYYRVVTINRHIYSIFPIGVNLISLPILIVIDKYYLFNHIDLYNLLQTYDSYLLTSKIENVISSFICALCSILIYILVRKDIGRTKSFILVLIFAFGTSVWSIASRSLWSHGAEILMLLMAMLLLNIKSGKSKHFVILSSLPIGLSVLIRPTGIIFLLLLSLYIAYAYKKYFLRYLVLLMIIITSFIYFNFTTFHTIFPSYYNLDRIGLHQHFIEATLGNLISPSRGLLIYSPIFIFSLLGIYFKIKLHKFYFFDFILVLILIFYYLGTSAFPHWWGGDSFGPRLLSGLIPILTYFLIPVLKFKFKHNWFTLLFVICLGMSVFIHYKGSNSFACWQWNATPSRIDISTDRLWDWHDIQFLR